MGKLIPILLAVVGLGGGIGAGIMFRPDPAENHASDADEHCAPGETLAKAEVHDAAQDADHSGADANEYVKFSNQFIIPVMAADRVESMVVLSLSLEVVPGSKEEIYQREPKLRDAFLQVLFNHANVGGFDGNFVDTVNLKTLRSALFEVAQKQVGEIAVDVLIVDLIKQTA